MTEIIAAKTARQFIFDKYNIDSLQLFAMEFVDKFHELMEK